MNKQVGWAFVEFSVLEDDFSLSLLIKMSDIGKKLRVTFV